MITLVHGDDTSASRTFFINARKRADAPITLEADKITMTDIAQVLDGGGLFNETKFLFIESLLTKKKKSNELTAMLTAFEQEQAAEIYLWEGKEIDKKTLATLKNVRSQLFTLPKSLFLFLDAIKPQNASLLPLFHKTLENVDVEMLFFMIIRQVRLLLAVSARDGEMIDEIRRMSPWQKTKLEKQSRLFKPGVLSKKYHALYDIDLAQKTGQLTLPLVSVIDFWIMEL